jgi:cell shape-determining protein MreC
MHLSPKRQFVPAHTKTRRIRIVAILVAIAAIFMVPFLRSAVTGGAATVGTGIGRGANSVGGFFASLRTSVRTKHALLDENAALKIQNADLVAKLLSRDTLVRENAELKAIMGRSEGVQFTLAAVLEKPPHSVYDTLVIDGGESAGFVVGQTVYANGETPIGAIGSVAARSAIVRLYSASGEKTGARLSPSNIDITLVGRGGGNFSAEVPHELAVELGATSVSKDIAPHVLAVFQKITSDPRDPFQTLLLASPINVNNLSFVQVRQ